MLKINRHLLQLACIIGFSLAFFICFQSPLQSVQLEQGESSQPQGHSLQPSSLDDIVSPRLIVELESPPLAELFAESVSAAGVTAKLDTSSATMQTALSALHAEQAAFMATLADRLPDAAVGHAINEVGASERQTYQTIFNGMAIDPGDMPQEEAMAAIAELPGVKGVYQDQILVPQLYRSVEHINAPAVWNSAAIGGFENAGRGIKIASIDTGVHHAAPMFDGTGYEYPSEYQPNGLGLTDNNNGKIIVSRAYFRSWDPLLPGEEFAWPGPEGDSHGNHTASIAAGECVSVTKADGKPFSGVAPKAYVMSYKVIYGGTIINAFYFSTAELIMALEDAVFDGADIINNSWTFFRTHEDYSLVDKALINVVKTGVTVVMSAGNEGNQFTSVHLTAPEYISVGAATILGDGSSQVAEFSSRGPTSNGALKPDLLAPGDDIFGQGYAGKQGEENHLGFGLGSGHR